MKLPISWLKDYVDFDDSVEGLAEKLTFSGVEVEAIDTVGCDMTGMVVGEVRSTEKHPDADRLTLCKVFDGKDEVDVVCGAPNVVAGMKGAFAPVGSVLADGTKLKKAKIRGAESFGMLCAEDELGLSDDHEGILVLDEALKAGTPLKDVFGEPETVLDLEITPNRPDCLSIIGLAREVAALYGTTLKLPAVQLKHNDRKIGELTTIAVEDSKGCPRYTAQVLHDAKINPAPAWMQKRLRLAGVRPINNVVDITNYVMLETGQPFHAFDQTLLAEGRIIVRRAKKKEKITTLDDIERELSPETLVICDAERPVALAGIMGGVGSEIRESTSTILLESAYFEPSDVRAASGRFALSSESSYRFERGVDVQQVAWASERAAALMCEHADATVAVGMIDVSTAESMPTSIPISFQAIRELTGIEADDEAITSTLESLQLRVDRGMDAATVHIPSFRLDLERPVDVAEEFARIFGLDKIPTPSPQARLVPGASDAAYKAKQELRHRLHQLGLNEAYHYSLVSEDLLNKFEREDERAMRIVVPNPLSQDQAVLRTTLIPQMVETLGRNHSRQIHEAALFEFGRTYTKKKNDVVEDERICIGLMGPVGRPGTITSSPSTEDDAFLWLKGLWRALSESLGFKETSLKAASIAYAQQGYAADLELDGQIVGSVGIVSQTLRNAWRISQPVAVLEAAVSPLLAHYGSIQPLQPVAAYPAIVRDVAMVIKKDILHSDIEGVIRKAAPEELEDVTIFDIFEGDQIGQGMKSVAYSLTYRSQEKTLTDQEANNFHDTVKAALKKQLGVEVREG